MGQCYGTDPYADAFRCIPGWRLTVPERSGQLHGIFLAISFLKALVVHQFNLKSATNRIGFITAVKDPAVVAFRKLARKRKLKMVVGPLRPEIALPLDENLSPFAFDPLHLTLCI